jgi:polyisoprenyl-phosphate glycosyltransferase
LNTIPNNTIGMGGKRIVIVIPVFDDRPSLCTLIEQLACVFSAQTSKVSLLVVDDGSIPALVNSIGAQFRSGLQIRILTLKRNIGHERAIAIGLATATGDAFVDTVVVMDADGEDNPADVIKLIAALVDRDRMTIAVGERVTRSESLLFRMLYQLYRILFLVLTGHQIRFGSLSAIPIAAARRLADMNELWLSLPATILRSHCPIVMVPTDRGRRFQGQSHMDIVSLMIFGLSAVAVFVERALTRIIAGALALVALAALASTAAIVLKVIGMATPGWVTTVLGTSVVILIGTAILCFVGLFLSIISGAHTIPAPSAVYRSFIARISDFDGTSWIESDDLSLEEPVTSNRTNVLNC